METASDIRFLRGLYAATRAAELAPVPWSTEQKAAFLESQFDLQRAHYLRLPDCVFYILERAIAPIGRLYLQARESTLHIVDISLLSEETGRGLATMLMPLLGQYAAESDRGLSLSVERLNPALRLYRRLGFVEVDHAGLYLQLERSSDMQRTTGS